MVKKLNKKGYLEPNAIKSVRGEEGNTALEWASRYGHTDIITLLKEAGAKEH
jgi:ankyrin repeat protein